VGCMREMYEGDVVGCWGWLFVWLRFWCFGVFRR